MTCGSIPGRAQRVGAGGERPDLVGAGGLGRAGSVGVAAVGEDTDDLEPQVARGRGNLAGALHRGPGSAIARVELEHDREPSARPRDGGGQPFGTGDEIEPDQQPERLDVVERSKPGCLRPVCPYRVRDEQVVEATGREPFRLTEVANGDSRAPAASCSRASRTLLCVFACGRSAIPRAANASASRRALRSTMSRSITIAGVSRPAGRIGATASPGRHAGSSWAPPDGRVAQQAAH